MRLTLNKSPTMVKYKEINFSGEELEENGAGDYIDIERTFRIYKSNDWKATATAAAK